MNENEKLLKAIDYLLDGYDAFYMMNRYSWEKHKNTHADEFKMLSVLKGDKVNNALSWIHDCYDCHYKNEIRANADNPFNYLRSMIQNEIN